MYIITKDGILRVMVTKTTEPMYIEGRGELIGYWGYKQNGDYVIGEILTKDIIKQADTIEELCDMFVFKVGESVIIDQDNDKFFRGNWKCYDAIYGAVWCDKGLIFVACMNNKGVFELL